MAEKYYLDTCIWLNLFKKEGDPDKGRPYWKIAQEFIEKIIFLENSRIFYSGFVLKELKYKLDRNIFEEKIMFLKNEKRFCFVKATGQDYSFAKKLETETQYAISFFDCLHLAVCKRLNLTLVTRDKELIKYSRKFIKSAKPEEISSS